MVREMGCYVLKYTAQNYKCLSERVRRSEADAGASLDIYNSERHYDRIIKIYQRRMP